MHNSGCIEEINVSGEECPSSDLACSACKELTSLDAQIEDARSLLRTLYLKRCQVKLRRNLHHDQLVRSLPIELVSRIFVHCLHSPPPPSLPEDDANAAHDARRPNPVSLVLAAVCQRWRQIAFSTPHLWTVVCVRISGPSIAHYPQMTSEWLRRSGHLPIWLDVYEERLQPALSGIRRQLADPAPIFDAINRHISRVETLKLHFNRKYLTLLRGETPILHQLFLSITGSQHELSSAAFRLADARPSPHRVIIRDMPYTAVGIEWASVTHFEAFSLTSSECLLLFCHSPHLTHCKIENITMSAAEFNPLDPQTITLSSLLTLILDPYRRCTPHAAPSVVASLTMRSNCALRELIINWFDGTLSQLIDVVKMMPSLEELSASHFRIHDEIFELLAATTSTQEDTPPEEVFLPNLRVLCLSGTPYFNWWSLPPIFSQNNTDTDVVLRPLSSFHLHLSFSRRGPGEEEGQTPEEIDEDVKQRLHELRAGGKEIDIVNVFDDSLEL
ncbi:hypothetical protein NLJ89_g4837 [Agrocybe chaxingu]|uniref:F-box domain-containing protein n=1 Tax=Agrocybe chaxingu TaxID=84603 RepID=A0A9W8K3C2_9AGAR|nr:hypothetical protein NLJ89_g4837 [Agrocybe chaxingu]